MKILLTGSNGILGKEITKNISNCITPSRNELDITNRKAVFEFIKINKFDVVIHTAALTSVRECENNKKNAWKTNVTGTQNIVDALSIYNPNTNLIYVSTACVFKGDGPMKKHLQIDLAHICLQMMLQLELKKFMNQNKKALFI